MLLPIKLATTKQPAKKKGKVTPVTPEEQAKGFEGLKRQAQLEEQQIAEFIAKQNYNPAEEARKRGVSVPTQPYERKINTGTLPNPVLSGEESVAKAQTEPKVAPRVQVNKQGLVVKTIETKYGNLKYTATPEESKIYLGSNIDAINKLTAEIAKDFENGFRQEGLKPKRQTKEKYKFDEVNAALNPNFIDEQTRKGVKAFEDVLLAPFDTFGIRKSLNEVADYAKQSDNALAQFGGGVLESVANPLTTFAMSTGNIADPTATAEEQTGAAFNLATYLISAIPVGEAVSASINAYRGVRGLAGIGKGINAGAKSLLRSTVPGGKWIDRKVTINDLVNVLERNGQMGGKTRGQLAREFASGGKTFAKATGQAPELFYNKYLNDLADQAQPATPAQFDVTAPKAPEAPTQVEDLGTVVDELVGKTEPVVPPSTIVKESDLEKLFQETVAPTLTPVKATRTRKPKAETVQPTPPANEDLGAVVDELTAQVESPVATEPTTPVVEPPVVQESEPIAPKTSVNTTPEELADPNVSVTQVPFKLDWTDRTSAQNSTNYLQGLKNLFKQNGELGIENIDDLPLLAVTKLHESNFNPKLTRAPINNKTPLPPSVYEKSIEELTYGEFKNMDWKLVPDTEANKDLIALLKQREEAFNRMVSHFKSNLGKGTTPQWKKVEELLKSRNNVIDPNDIELMDAMWELWSETSVVSEANVMFNRFYGDWFDKEKLRLFGRETKTRTKRATPGTLEQFADDQLEGLQKSWKEARSKMGANIQPEHFEFVARAVAYVISKTGLKLADALVETSKYLKQKFNFDITFDAEDIANIENKLRELNVSFEVSPPPVAPVAVSPTASKSTAPPPPTEPTVTGIPETPDEQLTSAKNRMTQEVRDEYDMGKFDEPTRRAWEESLTTAKQELQSNANAVDNVIAKVESKQAINEAEQSVLVVALSRERRNARALLEQTNEATSAEEIARLTEQTKIAEDRIDNYTNALNRAGSETARTLNARRAIIDAAEDVISIRAKARQTYGKTLEAADEEAITDIGKELEDINKQINDATGKGTTPVETVKANTRVKGIKESAPKLQPKADDKRVKQFKAVVNRVKEKLDAFVRPSTIETMGVPTEVDIWQPRLNDPASQAYFKQLASVQNDMGKVIQKLVTDEAIEDFDTLLTRLQSDGFNITDTDLKLILSADYPTTKLYDFSDIEKEYVKMVRRQLEQEAKGSSVAERGRLIKKIQDLSQKVQAGVRKATDKTVKTAFEENIDLQNRLDDLQAESNVKGQIDKLKEQIADPVLVDRIQREVPQYIQDLVHQREILRGQLNDKLRELADKKFREEHPYLNALEVAAKVPTELLVSLDNSAAFTHGAFRSIRNPLKWTKATSKSFQALISDGKYKDILASVRTRDNYDDMVRAGVAGIKQRDLQDATMYASVLQKVPYLGSLFKRSNAAMEVFGAVIRSDYFDALTEASRKEYLRGKITRSELLDRYKLQAEFINTVTGKGIKELPRPVSVIAPFANFGMSRIKTATMTPFFNAIAKGDKVAARQFATEFFKYVSTYMGALKVAQMFGLEVGIDPRDPEYFGKIKLPGVDKWWDMSGGILEPYRILINTKPVRNVTGAEESKYKTITNFAEGKLGAPAKTAMNVFQGMTGETPYGKNYDVRTDEGRLNVLMDNLPINVKTGKELVESDKSLGAKTAEAGLQFMGARLTKDKGSKARQPVTPGVTP